MVDAQLEIIERLVKSGLTKDEAHHLLAKFLEEKEILQYMDVLDLVKEIKS